MKQAKGQSKVQIKAKGKLNGRSGGVGLRSAVFAGSFDPLTLGHLDVIRRASNLFDRVVVAVGEARGKAATFTVAERLVMIEAECAALANVEAASFQGLAVDFAKGVGAVALLRGIRAANDVAYELQMAAMNQALAPGIETVFLPTDARFSHISSSLAKEVVSHGGDGSLLLSTAVAERLESRLKKR